MEAEKSPTAGSAGASTRERFGQSIWQTALAGSKGPAAVPKAKPIVLPQAALNSIIEALRDRYEVLGWVPGAGAVALTSVQSAADLALGYRDQQQPGLYQLQGPEPGQAGSYASFSHGSDSPKKFLHPSRLTLFEGSIAQGPSEPAFPTQPYAFLGMRSCDLAATLVNDRTFLGAPADPYYAARRAASFVVASSCTHSGGTCFCVSMGTGPRPLSGFDLRMTELGSELLLEPGSPAGADLLQQIGGRPATAEDLAEAERLVKQTADSQTKRMQTENLPAILMANLDHPYWDAMDDWCVGCTNCTIVCPTCFCYDVVDHLDPTMTKVTRQRYWDSCFTQKFTVLPDYNPRAALRARYRHWLNHKLSYWTEQFGCFGCIGCGRCITWCPVRIDITDVIDHIRSTSRGTVL